MAEVLTDYPDTRVVSFDLWLTLIKSDGSTFKTLRNKMFGEYLAPDMKAEMFDAITREVDKQADRVAETRGNDVMFDERVSMVAYTVGAPTPSDLLIEELYEKQTSIFKNHRPVLLNPKTPQILAELRQEHKTALVSNTGFIHEAEMRDALSDIGLGEAFDHMLFSNEVGFAKPDPRMYGRLIEAAGVEATYITHVGDNYLADVEGARSLGMNAIHLASGMTIEDLV